MRFSELGYIFPFHRDQKAAMRWPWEGTLPGFSKHSGSSVLPLAPFRLSWVLVPVTLPGLVKGKKVDLQGFWGIQVP